MQEAKRPEKTDFSDAQQLPKNFCDKFQDLNKYKGAAKRISSWLPCDF